MRRRVVYLPDDVSEWVDAQAGMPGTVRPSLVEVRQ